MLPQVAETVVVGGGPAGAASALFLARLGHRCLLLERSVPGERKLCGEFLSPEMLPLLRRLGVGETLAARGPARIRSVRITAPRSRRAWEAELPAEGWGLSRAAVDEALLQAAEREGVTVARGTMAVSISIDRADRAAPPAAVLAVRPARESGTVAIRARAVLLATGKTASPARQSRFARPSRFLAFQAHFEGPALGPRVELHAFRGGYVGLIDIEGGARNLCMLAPRMPSRPAVADDLLAMALAENETLAQWLTCARGVSPLS
ncbi:MAG: FAD-dependent monooxygenase, partial [Candidatus Eisenbacteria bacterium]|nr:FAD-dependent monooxygenase [Candidatus Eisenbacteria bacterium]